jgi:hypothetical protein
MRWDNHINIAKPLKELVLRVSIGGALAVAGQLLLAVAGQLLSELADDVAARKTTGTVCSSLMLAQWGVLFSEAQWSQRVDLSGSHLSLHRYPEITGYVVVLLTSSKLLLLLLLSSQSHVMTEGQTVSMSWFRVHSGNLWPDNTSCLKVAV